MTAQERELLEAWQEIISPIFDAHYRSAEEAKRLNYVFGIPIAILSAAVGTSAFVALDQNPSSIAKVAAGLTSILVAILASIQTFLGFSDRAEKHREAGAKFAALYKEIWQVLASPPKNPDELQHWMDDFRKRWDLLSLASPTTRHLRKIVDGNAKA